MTLDELVAQLEPSESDDRPGFYQCPVHGGGSLHVEAGDDNMPLVHCFGCGIGYQELLEALDDRTTGVSESVSTDIVVRRGRVERPPSSGSQPEQVDTGGAAPPRLHQPLEEISTRTGIPAEIAEKLFDFTDSVVVFTYGKRMKQRKL